MRTRKPRRTAVATNVMAGVLVAQIKNYRRKFTLYEGLAAAHPEVSSFRTYARRAAKNIAGAQERLDGLLLALPER
jgi:hypothetical protein